MSGLRYSDRATLAENGTLGPEATDSIPAKLQVAVDSIYSEARSAGVVGGHFCRRIAANMSQHFGTHFTPWPHGSDVNNFIKANYRTLNQFLDFIEILIEEASTRWFYDDKPYQAYPNIEDRLNRVFARHRFGYRVSNGEIRRVGSPALDAAVAGPALLATSREGWEEADRSYREALQHQRGGPDEQDDAITAAHAALEAAMKAAGLKGGHLDALAKSFRNSGMVPPQLEGVPEALDKLLKRSGSMRDSLGDAHGKAPGSEPVPTGVADLAIYWTGAFINYLAAATEG